MTAVVLITDDHGGLAEQAEGPRGRGAEEAQSHGLCLKLLLKAFLVGKSEGSDETGDVPNTFHFSPNTSKGNSTDFKHDDDDMMTLVLQHRL